METFRDKMSKQLGLRVICQDSSVASLTENFVPVRGETVGIETMLVFYTPDKDLIINVLARAGIDSRRQPPMWFSDNQLCATFNEGIDVIGPILETHSFVPQGMCAMIPESVAALRLAANPLVSSEHRGMTWHL